MTENTLMQKRWVTCCDLLLCVPYIKNEATRRREEVICDLPGYSVK
jgi:hypothetical protein